MPVKVLAVEIDGVDLPHPLEYLLPDGTVNYQAQSETPFSTSSQSDVAITGFSVTPVAGRYACIYNAAVYYTTVPKGHWFSFYRDSTKIAGSERSQDTAHSNQNMIDSTMQVIDFNGSQSLSVRVHCDNTGVLTVNSRTLVLIRLGDVPA